MTERRDWREAKMPAWARDAVEAEIYQWRLTAALSWPMEAKPEPLPFSWGAHDAINGEPVPGTYWAERFKGVVFSFDLCRIGDLPQAEQDRIGWLKYKGWAFKHDMEPWSTRVIRGPIFATGHDANLHRRWTMCEEFARTLLRTFPND